jgi:CubicO group peptidase (beta-lactamase class C family)
MTTAEDLASFLCAIDTDGEHEPGRGILKPETVDMMLTPTLETRGLSGLGYQVNLLRKFGYFIGHEGANEGFRSIFLFDPQKHAGIVILSNSDKGGRIFAEVICMWTKWADIELAYPCPEPVVPIIAFIK